MYGAVWKFYRGGGEGSGSLKVPEIFSSFAEVQSGVP